MTLDIIPYIPHTLAILNTLSATLVSVGYINIRKQNKTVHKACMISALAISTIFMIFYLYYHAKVGYIPFAGQGDVRYLYFSLLASHVILAAIVFPLVLITAGLAIYSKFSTHKRVARWTLPIWLYVSVSGVAIYVMSFHIYTN
jgi:putative membrane protein